MTRFKKTCQTQGFLLMVTDVGCFVSIDSKLASTLLHTPLISAEPWIMTQKNRCCQHFGKLFLNPCLERSLAF